MTDTPTLKRENLFPVLDAVAIWQADPHLHPLTCGTDSSHPPLVGRHGGDVVVLMCDTCGYEQTLTGTSLEALVRGHAAPALASEEYRELGVRDPRVLAALLHPLAVSDATPPTTEPDATMWWVFRAGYCAAMSQSDREQMPDAIAAESARAASEFVAAANRSTPRADD